jgi:nuclear pore complex protein Nup155
MPFITTCAARNELSTFTEQPHMITVVKVVKPRPGVFIDEINHVLVICTPGTVLLLGVSAQEVHGPGGRVRREIKLYETDLSISVEVEITNVVGMDDGRIFMSNAVGHVCELHYQEKEGWFGKRVQLINHSVGGVKTYLPLISTPKSSGMSNDGG